VIGAGYQTRVSAAANIKSLKGRLGMKKVIYTIAFVMAAVPGALRAQSVTVSQATQVETAATSSLRDQLMPAGAGLMVTAPATAEVVAEKAMNEPVMQRRSSGTPYMIAGGALLVAGLLIGGDAGTLVAVGGAVIGAYGLFLHF
jgi:hypothetical protein